MNSEEKINKVVYGKSANIEGILKILNNLMGFYCTQTLSGKHLITRLQKFVITGTSIHAQHLIIGSNHTFTSHIGGLHNKPDSAFYSIYFIKAFFDSIQELCDHEVLKERLMDTFCNSTTYEEQLFFDNGVRKYNYIVDNLLTLGGFDEDDWHIVYNAKNDTLYYSNSSSFNIAILTNGYTHNKNYYDKRQEELKAKLSKSGDYDFDKPMENKLEYLKSLEGLDETNFSVLNGLKGFYIDYTGGFYKIVGIEVKSNRSSSKIIAVIENMATGDEKTMIIGAIVSGQILLYEGPSTNLKRNTSADVIKQRFVDSLSVESCLQKNLMHTTFDGHIHIFTYLKEKLDLNKWTFKYFTSDAFALVHRDTLDILYLYDRTYGWFNLHIIKVSLDKINAKLREPVYMNPLNEVITVNPDSIVADYCADWGITTFKTVSKNVVEDPDTFINSNLKLNNYGKIQRTRIQCVEGSRPTGIGLENRRLRRAIKS